MMTVGTEKTATESTSDRSYADARRLLSDYGHPTGRQTAFEKTQGACRVEHCAAAAARGASRMRQEGRGGAWI